MLKRTEIAENIEIDGIPPIGSLIKKNTPIFSVYDTHKNSVKTFYHKDKEDGRLDSVAIVYNENNPYDTTVEYKLRISRNPVIGDKFSSRHG